MHNSISNKEDFYIEICQIMILITGTTPILSKHLLFRSRPLEVVEKVSKSNICMGVRNETGMTIALCKKTHGNWICN